jgi:hypothetical protein
MLTQWRSAGLLRQVAGIGVGRFSWRPDDVLPGDLALPLARLASLDGSRGQLALL